MNPVAFATILALASGAPSRQDTPPTQPSEAEPATELSEIEVTGRRLKEEVQSFISEVAAPPRGRPLARWDRSICVGVSNLDARYAQFMIDRIAQRTVEIGIDVEEPGCRPDIMVVAASDAAALARALVRDDPNGFRPARGATDRGSAALNRFQSTDAPVRWWHVSLPVSVDTGDVAIRLDGEESPTIAVRDASRLRSNIRDDLARVIVIIDVTKVGTIGFGALSDYVAMISLAQVDPDADTSGYDTVLNLFADGSDRSAGLTQWDKDYLTSLYRARRDRARATQQTEDILRGMTGERDTRIGEDEQQ